MQAPFGYCHCGCGNKTTISPHTSRKYGRVKGQPTKYLAAHGHRKPVTDYLVDTLTGCWIWQRFIDPNGYGRTPKPVNGTVYAHRIYYEAINGPIPKNRKLVQTCQNRLCVNPLHLRLKTADDLFWERVKVGEPNECWPWLAGKGHMGHGNTRWRMKRRMAHVVAYEIVTGKEVLKPFCVLHRCDNPPCCNPRHLFEGTKRDNAQDMVSKRRSLFGERNNKAKLTEADVLTIRKRVASGETQTAVARDFHVGQPQIGNIVRGDHWKHV